MEVCPTHGPVYAVLWKGQLVCPDPECHRTCIDGRLTELTALSARVEALEDALRTVEMKASVGVAGSAFDEIARIAKEALS